MLKQTISQNYKYIINMKKKNVYFSFINNLIKNLAFFSFVTLIFNEGSEKRALILERDSIKQALQRFFVGLILFFDKSLFSFEKIFLILFS